MKQTNLERYRSQAHRRPPLWNVRPSLVQHLPTLRAAFPSWSRQRHLRRALALSQLIQRLIAEWHRRLRWGERRYRATGPMISGGFHSHWPSALNERIRTLAQAVSTYRSALHLHLQAAGRIAGKPSYAALAG